MASRIRAAVTVLSLLVMGVVSTPAYAGCGCEKPAPAVAPVRPHATYAGTGLLYGLLYAPNSSLEIKNDAEFFGSLVGHEVELKNSALVHYDTALRGDGNETSAPSSN